MMKFFGESYHATNKQTFMIKTNPIEFQNYEQGRILSIERSFR